MDDKFYQHFIEKTDAIVKELGCENVQEALQKLEVENGKRSEQFLER